MKIRTLLERDGERTLPDNVRQYLIELVEVIKKAQPFFQKAGSSTDLFYRGSGSEYPEHQIEILQPRLDRKPRDSLQMIHDALDNAMEHEFGYRYRSGSVFVSSDYGVVQEYGTLYIALPLGQFDYCWSSESDDSILWFSPRSYFKYAYANGSDELKEVLSFVADHASSMFGAEGDRKMVETVNTNPEAKQLFQRWFSERYDEAAYSLENLPAALEQGHEIMVKCSQYAMITPDVIGLGEAKFLADYLGKPELERELFNFVPVSKAIYIIANSIFGA